MSVFSKTGNGMGEITVGTATVSVGRADLAALAFAFDYLETIFLVSEKGGCTSVPASIIENSGWSGISVREDGSYGISRSGIKWDVSRAASQRLRTLLRNILLNDSDLPLLEMA